MTNYSIKQYNRDIVYLAMTFLKASLSKAERAKVGSMIVKDGIIISTGYNGMPRNTDNCCEHDGHTKDEVIHAELNAILNMVISGNGTEMRGSTIYITYMPCVRCSALIKQVGISRVVYSRLYRDTSGIDFLKENGIEVVNVPENEVFEKVMELISFGEHKDTYGDLVYFNV